MTNDETKSGQITTRSRPRTGYDLEERTALFGESVIRFCKSIPTNDVTGPLIRQVVRSGTSVGANYCEADDAISGKEFRQKIGTCKKESRETKHWLRMIAAAEPNKAEAARILWKEAQELLLIFASIFRKLSTKKK
ncbi:MAG TPA: four helix bundle protein [Fimbriiglobus sp.]|jgi:four helix bundle protein